MEEPAKAEGDWEDKVNKNSLIIKKGCLMNRNLIGSKHLDRYQFERLGYFAVDFDSDVQNGKYVWNKIIGLVDNAKAKAMERMKDK